MIFTLGCNVNDRPGDGTTMGSCNQGQLCHSDGTCSTGILVENYFAKLSILNVNYLY